MFSFLDLLRPKPNINYDYLILLVLIAITILTVRLFNFDQVVMLILIFSISLVYVFWGIIHHKKAGHIDKKIVLEYVSLALLVNIIIATLIS